MEELQALLRHFSGTACAVLFDAAGPCAALRLDAAGHGAVGRQRSGLRRVAAEDRGRCRSPTGLQSEFQRIKVIQLKTYLNFNLTQRIQFDSNFEKFNFCSRDPGLSGPEPRMGAGTYGHRRVAHHGGVAAALRGGRRWWHSHQECSKLRSVKNRQK